MPALAHSTTALLGLTPGLPGSSHRLLPTEHPQRVKQPGHDTVVKFYFDIPTGVDIPSGIYTIYVMVWTDWAHLGGICVDFIAGSFIVE